MSLINVSNLTFGYEGSADNVFENISFSINSDWKLGMTGRNGRGKTTFLKLLMNKYEYSGSITQGESFEYFPYNNFDEYEITGDIIGRISAAEPWQIERELSLLGVDAEALYRPFCTLSNGERTKALIAGLFLKQNSFLLIDEPTNHLDEAGRKTLAEYLNRKKGFILVSHDRNFLDACVDHILAVNKTSVEVIRGNFSTWQYEKNLRDSFETERNERLRRDIKKLEAASRRTADWSDRVEKTKKGARNGEGKPDRGFIGHKAAKMMKRSKAIENRREAAAEEKSRLLKDIEENESLKISPLKYHSARLCELRDISIAYGEKRVCSGVSFTVSVGDRIALKGKNGCGKSSVLKLILGEQLAHRGSLSVASGLKISYVPQSVDDISGSLTDYADKFDIDESLFKAVLRKLGFARADFERDISDFSAGQKKKTALARSLCEKAHLYIWDEPLNYIDVISRMQIEELINNFSPTLLFVEHDAAFCENIGAKGVVIGG